MLNSVAQECRKIEDKLIKMRRELHKRPEKGITEANHNPEFNIDESV